MTEDALLAEIMRRADFVFAGWNVLMGVGVGVLAVVALSAKLRADRRAAGVLAAAFAFFALTHLLGMLHVVKQWASLTDALKHMLAANSVVAEKLDFALMAPHVAWIVPFHLAFDALVLAAAWWLTRPSSSG